MKVCIIETAPIPVNPIDAHVRNAIELQRYLRNQGHNCDLLGQNQNFIIKQYDIVIISYASLYFDFKKFEPLVEANKDTAKFGWLTNEYNLSPNGCFKKYMTFVIANFEEKKWKKKWYKDFLMVNLNTLFAKERNVKDRKPHEMVYYGTYRPDRIPYFKKYLQGNLILSTSEKNKVKYKTIGAKCKFAGKLNWASGKETLNQFKASLYIEDEVTHELYNHLANRFYEALYCNTAIFFDRSCKFTIEKSGYDIDEFFMVSSYEEMAKKIKDDKFTQKTEEFLCKNTEKALEEKAATLDAVHNFLKGLL
jgi:hypothetical protein